MALLFSVYRLHYATIAADGTSEINYSFSTFTGGTLSDVGGGAILRWYVDKNGQGLFYGGGLWIFLSVSDIGDVDPGRGDAISLVPDIISQAGYRYDLNTNTTIALWAGPGIRLDIPLAEGGSGPLTGLDIFLGIDLSYRL